ncbi:AAA family ATPase [Candidatus Woesearchaeota archaeon]|nr:AAA family ATPase [Candidatus Woesearchaeota archaeon]
MRSICFLTPHRALTGSAATIAPLNIAAGLARAGKRVLLVDLHSTSTSRYHQQLRHKNLYHYIIDHEPLSSCTTRLGMNLEVMGSQGFSAEAELFAMEDLTRRELFTKHFRDLHAVYDYVLFDGGSSLGLLTQNALYYCAEAIPLIPTTAHGIDYGMKMIRTILLSSQLFGKPVRISRILPIEYKPDNHYARSMLAMLFSEYTGQLVMQPIEDRKTLEEATMKGQSVYTLPSSTTARQFRAVVEMIVQDEQLYDSDIDERMRRQAQLMRFSKPRADVPLQYFTSEVMPMSRLET